MSPGRQLLPAETLSLPARVVDSVLEASVVGSFSRVGPDVRRRLAHWEPPSSAAGRQMVVTGATSGLGLAAATELARLGASVCLVGRDPTRTADAVTGVQASSADGAEVTSELADLGDLDQVADLADRLAGRFERIDVLVHNAGALLRTRQTSPQGTEATVTVHLLAPYLLTERLLPRLASSAPSRVITMTSGGMYAQRFDLHQLVLPEDGYDGVVAYARAKRAQVVLTHEWQRRYGPEGVDFHIVHPGWTDTPGLTAGLPGFARRLRPLLRPVADGADSLVWLSGCPDRTPDGGRLWLDRRPRGEYHLPWTRVSSHQRAADGRALWAWCHQEVGDRLPPG